MSTRRIWKFGALVAAALMLAATGCGGGTGGQSANPNDKLVIWHMEQPPNRVAAWQKVIDEFNKTNPSAKVEQQVQDWNQVYSKIAGAVQSRTQPDVLFTIPDFTTYEKQMGVVQPVNTIVNDRGRMLVGYFSIYLHFFGLPGEHAPGLTVSRMKKLCSERGICSGGRAETMLILMRMFGHLETTPAANRTAVTQTQLSRAEFPLPV